jgi:hypothetical protein
MKVTSFDRPTVKALRVDLDSALAKVAKEYGIEISTGNISFSGDNCSIKVKASVIGSDGTVMTKEATDFDRYARYELPGVKVGDTFMNAGTTYTITGWKARSRKYPVTAVSSQDGKTYKVPVRMVKAGL